MGTEMELKKLHMGTMVFGFEAMDEVASILTSTFSDGGEQGKRQNSMLGAGAGRGRRDISGRVRDAVLALATCHNVRPLSS